MLQQYLFYIFSTIAIFSGGMMIVSGNPVRCALYLIFSFMASAGLWLLAGAEFLALILILVYVGAVMTLFLFVVMMLQIKKELDKQNLWVYFFVSMLIIGIIAYCMQLALQNSFLTGRTIFDREIIDNISAIGMVLYTTYGYPFVIAGALLLVAIISTITLVNRPAQDTKIQNIRKQMQTKKQDRIRLVDITRN